MRKTYLFYDTETSGTNHCFDQILQFAAIRTDENLDPIENMETEFRLKLRPDIIPSPGALLTTHMSIENLNQGKPEYEAIQQIHKLINQPGTTSVGYNLFAFDDLMLRFAFYRNLLDPYSHQFQHNCSRLDILPIVALYYLYKPETLHWPRIDGKIKLKLELINELNKLAEGDAHDALVDVRVTIALAKRLKQHDPQMWASCLKFFEQSWVANKLAKSNFVHSDHEDRSYPEALLIASWYGAHNNFQCHVLHLGYETSKQKRANWLVLDRFDFQTLVNIEEFPLINNKKINEPPLIVPYNDVRDKRPEEKLDLSRKNRIWLQQHPDLLQQLAHYVSTKQLAQPTNPIDIDADLYGVGFASMSDKQIFGQFHTSSTKGKQDLLARIQCPTRKKLAIRILFRNYDPSQLKNSIQSARDVYLQTIAPQSDSLALFDYKGTQRTTPYSALADLERLRQNPDLTIDEKGILNGLEKYILDTFIYPSQHSQ